MRYRNLIVLGLAGAISLGFSNPAGAGEKRILFWKFKTKPVPGVASRGTYRLPSRVQQADEAALRGSMAIADGHFAEAVGEFKKALEVLPDAPLTKERRDAYASQLKNATKKLREQQKSRAAGPKVKKAKVEAKPLESTPPGSVADPTGSKASPTKTTTPD